MNIRKLFLILALSLLSVGTVPAQTGDVVITLDEGFFQALIDAVFKDGSTIDFANANPRHHDAEQVSFANTSFEPGTDMCDDTVRLVRELKGRRTAVQLRDGKIFAPIAFTGAYAPPLIGCIEYSGVADTEISLEFDKNRQSLVGVAKVVNVDLSGTGGVGGSLIAKFVQRSIDEKINPMQILGLDSVSFAVPVQNKVNVTLKAVNISHEIANGSMTVRVTYEFVRA